MIFTVTLNPAVDRELTVDEIVFDTVLRASQWQVDCGGKGFNVARMLNSLGVSSIAIGFAAGKTGGLLDDKLKAIGIETDFVWVEGETRTNVSIISSENGKYVKVNEPGPTIKDKDIVLLKDKIRSRVKPGDWWVLAGSVPPGVPGDIYAELIEIIHGADAQVFLDTSSEPFKRSCTAAPLLVKPNTEEAHELTGLPVNSTEDIIAAGRVIQGMGPKSVIVSLGKEGALLINGQDTWLATSPAVVEKNPIGAGDSMVAGIVWGLSEGAELSDSLCRGIACGAATASQSGTSVGTFVQVRDLLPEVQLKQL